MLKYLFSKGSLLSLMVYGLFFRYFESIFNHSPVNLMQLGSVSGGENLFINVCSFVVLTFLGCILITPLVRNKIKWLKEILFGLCLAVILSNTLLLIFLFNWRNNVPSSPA